MSGAIFIFTIAMFPYVFILARISFSMISKTVVELVALQKLSPKKAFFKVYLPLSYPAIFAGSILAIMETLSDYGTVLYFGIETFSVGVFKSWFGYGDLAGAINVAIILLIFVFSILLVEHNIQKNLDSQALRIVTKKQKKIKLSGKNNFYAFLISFFYSPIYSFYSKWSFDLLDNFGF